ncbi:MAG: hypothetical protein RLZZ42_991, partial [Bacteroidota bacterium]
MVHYKNQTFMLIPLLQVPDSASPIVSPPATVSKTMHLFDVLQSGGALMIPLGLLFVLAVFFFFERYIAITKAGKIDDNFMRIIRDHIANG